MKGIHPEIDGGHHFSRLLRGTPSTKHGFINAPIWTIQINLNAFHLYIYMYVLYVCMCVCGHIDAYLSHVIVAPKNYAEKSCILHAVGDDTAQLKASEGPGVPFFRGNIGIAAGTMVGFYWQHGNIYIYMD